MGRVTPIHFGNIYFNHMMITFDAFLREEHADPSIPLPGLGCSATNNPGTILFSGSGTWFSPPIRGFRG